METFQSDKVLVRTLFNNFENLLVFVFHSKWSEESVLYVQNFTNLIQTFGPYQKVKFFAVEESTAPETFKKFEVDTVPTVIFTQTDKTVLKRFVKETPATIFESLEDQIQLFQANFQKNQAIWHPKIENILQSTPFIIFVKGTPANPKCGFTSQLLEILDAHQIEYSHYDIIADEYMRYWLRHWGKQATYPQVYIKGKLLGGLDTVKELVSKGQFESLIPKESKRQSGEDKYKSILSANKNIVFLDGFLFQNNKSKEFVDKLRERATDFSLINVRQDEKLNEYLKSQNLALPAYFEAGQQVSNI